MVILIGSGDVATEKLEESPAAPVEQSTEAPPPAAEESTEANPAAGNSGEDASADAEENSGDAEATPEIKLETAPADFRFPTTNQTKNCFTRYIEYHRCVAAKGEDAPECDKFVKYYRALCPGEWVDRWNGPGTITTTTTTTGSSNVNNIDNRDQYLKHLNKLSHKISKPSTTDAPPIIKKASFDHSQNLTQVMPPPQIQQPQLHNPNQSSLQAQQNQPPVYNINKNDFRDVVQKLISSPAHERFSTQPPPIHQSKPQSSRLQRIRPPPLAHVSNRPAAPMINCTVPNMNPPISGHIGNSFIQQPPGTAPLSPLPPFPAVHAAAESSVSAYMRYFQNSMSSIADFAPKQFSGFPPFAPLISPRWNNLTAPQQQQQPSQVSSSGMNQSQLPPSTLPFGCLNSLRSSYPLLSPSSLFSPNSGEFGFPLSPTVSVLSPKWRGLR